MGVPHINPYAKAKTMEQAVLIKAMRMAQIPIGIKTKLGKLDFNFANDVTIHITHGSPSRIVYMFWIVNNMLSAAIFKPREGICAPATGGASASISDPYCFEKVSGFIYLNRVH